jgi:hypothetical protein
MLRDKRSFLRVLITLLLAVGMFVTAVESSVRAATVKNPAKQDLATDTPTDTLTNTLVPTSTPTDTPSITLSPSMMLTLTTTTTASLTPSRTLTPTPTPTFTATVTKTGTPATATPTAPRHIVISEFRTVGLMGADDEFIELYNPTGAPINIGNWIISKSSGCGTSLSTMVTIYYGTVLQPGQHYLAAAYASYSSITNADQRFSPGIADTSGLALVSSDGTVIDKVGMCADTYYYEGRPLPPLPVAPLSGTPTPQPGTSNQSYERKPGGNTSCYDTGDNVNDFSLISPPNPQTQANGSFLCAGVVLTTATPTLTSTITFTRTPTRAPTAIPAAAVLNEFLPHPQNDWNGDGTANVGDEYIEIINVSTIAQSVQGWSLDTGVNSLKTFTLPDLILQPRQIATFFGSQTGLSLSDGGGTVRLVGSDGRIVDAYTYPAVELPERTWCRLPDGTAAWGFACRPTPGQPNISVNVLLPGSASGGGSNCPQGNVAPQALVMAECGSFGAGIANDQGEEVFWLQSRWKWDVFLE